jgi:hypothetical protein
MTYKDIQKGIVYKITKASSDRTFDVGDIIALDFDNSILFPSGGWLDYEDYHNDESIIDFECEVSKTHYLHNEDAMSHGIRPIPTTYVLPWDRQLKAINA